MKSKISNTIDDEKTEKFERLAERRVNEAIKKLRLVSNLANKRNYSYSEDHAKKIVDVLESEFRMLKLKFKDESGPEGIKFSFKDK